MHFQHKNSFQMAYERLQRPFTTWATIVSLGFNSRLWLFGNYFSISGDDIEFSKRKFTAS